MVYKAEKAADKARLCALVLIVVLPILFPLYFIFISSLKNMSQVYIMPPQLLGSTPIWDRYRYIFKTWRYDTYVVDNVIVASASTAISPVFGVPISYSIAQSHMYETSASTLVTRLSSSISSLLPYCFPSPELKMIDIHSVPTLSHIVFSLPLIVWAMLSFITDIPRESDEAAVINGRTRQGCFWSVILPVSLPGLVTCATLFFLGSWNNFQFALVLSRKKARMLPVSLQYSVSGTGIRWDRVLVTTIVVIIPAIILTMALQGYIIKGVIVEVIRGRTPQRTM